MGSSNVGAAGAQALTTLAERSLESLTLHIRVGDAGAQALASLKDAPSLRVLHLLLQNSDSPISDVGAGALASFKDEFSLRVLSLDLDCSYVSSAGIRALASLKTARSLHTLALKLWNSADDAMQAIVSSGKGRLAVQTPNNLEPNWPFVRSLTDKSFIGQW